MIKFLQDYTTTALPPEHFEAGQEADGRSEASEAYFVRLGVAGYLVDGNLLDQDYRPIVEKTVVVVETPRDRRFVDAGRAGEALGREAPQRASTGPGNAVVFGAVAETGPTAVEFEQLRTDMATSAQQFDDYRAGSDAEKERLKGLLDAANEAFRVADTTHTEERTALAGERDQALADLADAKADGDAKTARIAELEAQVAASGGDTKPAKAK